MCGFLPTGGYYALCAGHHTLRLPTGGIIMPADIIMMHIYAFGHKYGACWILRSALAFHLILVGFQTLCRLYFFVGIARSKIQAVLPSKLTQKNQKKIMTFILILRGFLKRDFFFFDFFS